MPTWTLSGTGVQAVSSPGSLALVVTAGRTLGTTGRANPVNLYHIGLLRLGTAHGYGPAIPVDAVNQVIGCPTGTVNVGYELVTGVTITIEERPEIIQPVGTLATSSSPPAPNIVTPFSDISLGGVLAASAAAVAASGAYASANRAHFYPFRLAAPFTSTYIFWLNGATVSGNVCAGVYDSAFVRLGTTGSTAQAGVQAIQSIAFALSLTPGLYYLAIVMDNVTGTLYNCVTASPRNAIIGARSQNTAFVLPNPATPAIGAPVGNVYVVGLATYQP